MRVLSDSGGSSEQQEQRWRGCFSCQTETKTEQLPAIGLDIVLHCQRDIVYSLPRPKTCWDIEFKGDGLVYLKEELSRCPAFG